MSSDSPLLFYSNTCESTSVTVTQIKKSAPEKLKIKPAVDPSTLSHKHFEEGAFWHKVPAYQNVSQEEFLDHNWQARNSITKPAKLLAALQALVPQSFYDDVAEGFDRAPMSIRVSPYMLSLINWDDPYNDPLRIQFIPVASRLQKDHPKLTLDSLHEQADSPVAGLTHRYTDKALFLVLDTCPVYCRFCTRSYAVGINTDQVEKISLKAKQTRWEDAFEYIESRPELEDIVISGGDTYQLKARQIETIGMRLLSMDNIRRIRFATKGPAVMPQKIISDEPWLKALSDVVEFGRKQHKEVVIHTHFNHGNEISWITKRAMEMLFERGITVRNQSVLQNNVNDTNEDMKMLVKRLAHVNVHPYYVYQHDLVQGVEDLRTSIATACDLEKNVRGITAGFNTPTFVCDAPGGGGKRNIHSYEHYDRETGISVWTAPSVKKGHFLYFDPIHSLSEDVQKRWADASTHQGMIDAALKAAGV